MNAMTEIRRTFFEECDEQLAELDAGLRAFETGTADKETIGVVFRAVHSIKGGAGAFELKELVRFALTYEGVLNEVRSDRLVPDPDVLALFRRAFVVLTDLVAVSRDRESVHAELRALIPGAEAQAEADEDEDQGDATPETDGGVDLGFVPVAVDLGDFFVADERRYRIVFTPRPELYANANESARLIRELLALGSGEVVCDTSETPMLDRLEPEGAFLSWTIELSTEAGEGGIREIFDFAEFDCDLDIACLDEEDAGDAPADLDTLDPDMAALFARLQAAG